MDIDTSTANLLRVVIQNVLPGDEYMLAVASVPGVDMDQQINGSSRIITYSGEQDISVYVDLLSLRFFNSLDEPEPGTRLVSIQVFTPSDTAGSSLGSNIAIVTIEVRPLNDNPPRFSQDFYNGLVAENDPTGTSVNVVVAASDDDIYGATMITYSIPGSNPYFTIDAISGTISTLQPLDADTSPNRIITVIASDNDGPTSLSSSVEVTIRVLDVNDLSPLFNQSSYVQRVPEGSPIGTSILTVFAEDLDVTPGNSIISFLIRVPDLPMSGSGMESDTTLGPSDSSIPFEINSISGEVSVISELDFELVTEYNFEVLAVDSGTPPLTGTTSVTITILDVNDNAPQLDANEYRISVPENTVPPSQVLTISAIDADSGLFGEREFSLLGTNFFFIDATTGALSLVEFLDYEIQEVHTFTVVVTDRGNSPLSSSAQVIVDVINVNDNTPLFVPDSYQFEVPENFPFEEQVSAIDADGASLTYSLEDDEFEIDAITGVITNRAGSVLDYEDQTLHSFVVAASDGVFVTRANVTVSVFDENDNPPIFTQSSYTVSISETLQGGSSVVQVEAQDADSGVNAVSSYSIASGNTDEAFNIDSASGIISTSRMLDFETVSSPEFVLIVTATNTAPPHFSSSTTVTVVLTDTNDVPPVLSIDDTNVTFVENSGPLLFTPAISITDADTLAHPITQCTATLTRGPCDSLGVTICSEAISLDESLLNDRGLELSITDDIDQVTVLVSGNSSAMDYQTVLSTLEYSNLVLEPVPGIRQVEIVCEDSSLQSNVLEISISVELVNEFCPVIAASVTSFSFVEGSGELLFGQLAGFSATDRDRPPHNSIMQVQIVLSNRLDGDFESISGSGLQSSEDSGASGLGGIDTFGPQNVTVYGLSSLESLVQVLQSLFYTNSRPEPTLGERLVSIHPIDDSLDCEPFILAISISPINDNPPDLTLSISDAVQYVEGSGPLQFAAEAGLMVIDPDHNNLFPMESAQVVLNGVMDTGMELLGFDESLLAGITASAGGGKYGSVFIINILLLINPSLLLFNWLVCKVLGNLSSDVLIS